MNALEVRSLCGGYGRIRVLHDVSFVAPAGGLTLLLGANGAGKSTTLRAISGMIRSQGRVELAGIDVSGWPVERLVRAGVAHVPQGRGTFETLTVEENLRLGAYKRTDATCVRQDIERWLSVFPRLRERARQRAGTLSGGEQQMLAVTRALMSRPRVLLLDEPSLGLAPSTAKEIFAALATIKAESQMAMLMVEQNAALGLDLADHALVLDAGRLVFDGEPSELRRDRRLAQIYLGSTQ
jgi:branched-chain amino acid transport system ATP-binding protein